ncbi:6-phosphogluconolactonase [Microbacterium sp.]|uniref:6-phosphogluconolactonase n=1 Tax=Microbacterium sp. TaxID=51671 RepID=UPI0039E51F73
MTHLWTEKRVVISTDAAALTSAVARRLVARLVARSAAGKTTHLALSGAPAGRAVLEAAGADAARGDVDWSRVHLWWADEAFAPHSAERADTAARRALRGRIEIPAENVHAYPAPGEVVNADAAASAYADELARFGDEGQPWPSFFVTVLEVETDGSIAALYPDRGEIQLTERAVVAVPGCPQSPHERLTLTRPVINSARCVWLVVSGSDKAAALGLALAGASYETVPAAGAKGRRRTLFFVDRDAAAAVPPELIDQDF